MFADKIVACLEHDSKRHYLRGVPIVLVASTEYNPGPIYWLDYLKCVVQLT